jgi:adenylate cyclase
MARHKYKIQYSPEQLGASGPPPSEEEDITAVLGKSLLERAGLQRRADTSTRRFDVNDDSAGQLKKKKELD